jgi:asparagine synthase (glutamine-hydrolysing)
MSGCLTHRGPDGSGLWIDAAAEIGLAHRRLAVLGLGDEGAQPMVSRSGRFVIVYNGEIYNHLELRSMLDVERRASPWRGASDTETMLASIEAWGLRTTLTRAVGMWALALWDRDRGVLSLARDRMGEKPLSFTQIGGTFAFASTPGPLRCVPGFNDEIDPDALSDLLRFAQIPRDRGIYVGVRKLPAGTILEVRQGATASEPVPYWSFMDAARDGIADPLRISESEQVDAVSAAIDRAVQGQLLSDVPLGAFLSGGIDSSFVVAAMQRVSSQPVRTFTVGFAESGFDESAHARAVAEHLGTVHTEVVLAPKDALELIPDLARIHDEPFADSSQIPTTLLSRLARREVTVALSGDGGDELFGGYERYATTERLARLPRLVGLGAAVAYGLLRKDRKRTLGWDVAAGDWSIVRRLLSANPRAERLVLGTDATRTTGAFRDDWRATAGLGGLTARSMALDSLRYLPDDILHKVDRAAMSASLEARVPLLDHRVVELAWRLPMSAKVRDGHGKWVLRELLARDFPRHLFERPKAGFGIPVGSWLAGPLRAWAEELLATDRLRADGLLDVGAVRRIWSDHVSGRWDAGHELWPILMFQAWRSTQGTRA